MYLNTILSFALIALLSCDNANYSQNSIVSVDAGLKEIVVGADRIEEYLELLKGKKVALVANHASTIGDTHIVDRLISEEVDIVKVFSPEHGFRGDADAGENVKSEIDAKTKLPIISLYGDNKKPKKEQLSDVQLIVFDLQDVGVRFYTYISTLHYVIEAAAELNIPLILLDRPNPNANYIDGPVLKEGFESFVGLHPIPVVYGLTIGELAVMINEERWTNATTKCNLKIISCLNYTHQSEYILPIPPSPNLPNQKSIYLYPSLCFFEGTDISVGRGTNLPFQQIGAPILKGEYEYYFIPKPTKGAKNPKWNGKKCYGLSLGNSDPVMERNLNLDYLIEFYKKSSSKKEFFNSFFNLLAGQDNLKKSIEKGESAAEIAKSWNNDKEAYLKLRSRYLIYED
jgi:uncharacterized protein YbbC (DUF1343 family)